MQKKYKNHLPFAGSSYIYFENTAKYLHLPASNLKKRVFDN